MRLWVAPLAALVCLISAQEGEEAADTADALESADSSTPAAVVKRDDPRQIVNIDGVPKFSVYVGPANGLRRVLVQELVGGNDNFPADATNPQIDGFGAYDDNSFTDSRHESPLVVPVPFGVTTTTTTLAPPPPPPTTQPPPPPPTFTPERTRRPHPTQPPVVGPSVVVSQTPFVPQQPSFPPTFPPVTSAPQFPTVPQAPPRQSQDVRTGSCSRSIFYISTPIGRRSRLVFTHFAVAVSVDQCARTCHEFNCAIAHFNPSNGHCQFNPGTAFAIKEGQCPAWPSLHYRNNVVATETIRIFCVQCRRPRRKGINRGLSGLRKRTRLNRRHGKRRGKNTRRGIFTASETTGGASSQASVSTNPVIHGVLLRQPQSVSLGLSSSSFLAYTQPRVHGAKTRQMAVAHREVEEGEEDSEIPLAPEARERRLEDEN